MTANSVYATVSSRHFTAFKHVHYLYAEGPQWQNHLVLLLILWWTLILPRARMVSSGFLVQRRPRFDIPPQC